MIQPDHEVLEPKPGEHVCDGCQQLGFNNERRRTNSVDVALVKLTKSPSRRPVRPPDWLNLIPLEKPRQLVLILCDHSRQGNGEVVAKREICTARRLVLASLQNLENQLVAFIAVLPEQRLDILERR